MMHAAAKGGNGVPVRTGKLGWGLAATPCDSAKEPRDPGRAPRSMGKVNWLISPPAVANRLLDVIEQ